MMHQIEYPYDLFHLSNFINKDVCHIKKVTVIYARIYKLISLYTQQNYYFSYSEVAL